MQYRDDVDKTDVDKTDVDMVEVAEGRVSSLI